MKHYLSSCFFLLTLFVTVTAAAQPVKNIDRNTLYADFAIKGATYSVNYDRVFSYGKKLAKSFRVGFSVLNDAIAFPLGIQFYSGKEAHHLEYSLTIVPYIEKYQDLFSGTSISDKKLYILPGLGYRYQPPTGGFFAKIVAGPLIYLDPAADDAVHMETKVYPGITAGAGFSF